MSSLAAFAIFIFFIALSLLLNISMLFPLGLGMLLFSYLAYRQGNSVRSILKMAIGSLHDSFIVIGVLLLIGCLTGLWRLSGTIAYFVSIGVTSMPPSLFILAAFLINAAISFAIGTSFGVAATAGVIVMSIAKAGGIPLAPVAGAVLSGIYVGDRGSPASSASNLVASLTQTDMRRNIREMLKTSVVPFIVTCVVYGLISFKYPINRTDSGILTELSEVFSLSWICLIPAILMIILPFCHVSIKLSMTVDIIVSVIIAVTVQKAGMRDCLQSAVLGYRCANPELAPLLSGGGLVSMLEVCGILVISGTYGRIFRATGMLDSITEKLLALKEKTNRFAVMILLSTAVCMIFCNQTVGSIMVSQLSDGLYGDDEAEKTRKMLDIENTVIVIAGIVPWCIACSVPLAMIGGGKSAIAFAFYLWLIPLYNLILQMKTEKP